MKSHLLIIILFLSVSQAFAQDGNNVLIVTKNGMKNIPAYVREGTIYFSLKDFGDAVGVNYYYNEDVHKIEIKFNNYYVKASARNPFLVLTEKNGTKQLVIQLPTSTFIINKKVYVPLIYSLSAIQQAYGNELTYEAPNKIIIGQPTEGTIESSTELVSRFNLTGIVVNEKANGTLITVRSNKRIPSYLSAYKNNVLTLHLEKLMLILKK